MHIRIKFSAIKFQEFVFGKIFLFIDERFFLVYIFEEISIKELLIGIPGNLLVVFVILKNFLRTAQNKRIWEFLAPSVNEPVF